MVHKLVFRKRPRKKVYLKTYLSNTPNTVDQIQIQIQIHGLKFDQIQIQIQIRRICICICICKYKYVFDPSPVPGTRKQNRDAWRADIQHRLVLPTPQNGTQTAPLSKNGYGWMGGCGNSSALVMKSPQCCAEHSMFHQTSNISCTLVGNKIVDHSDIFGAALVGELQVHLYSWLNTWLEWIRQRQLQDEARKFKFVDLVQLIL